MTSQATRIPDSTSLRFRRAAGRFPTGVAVVSTLNDGQPHAMTVNSFVTVSLEPLMVLVSLGLTCRTYERIHSSGIFAVTVLGAHQQPVADWFASSRRGTGAGAFTGVDWRPAPCSSAPILEQGVSYFDCEVVDVRVAGDHAVVFGAVQAFDILSDGPALMFADSRYVACPPPAAAVTGAATPAVPSQR
ncbi:flavin reductase family protein [Micromonospora sp. NPDC048871]|uniref:flavin reductase family protein n=1 Tax=unclassified Micromonospora TaxID=2617518 RepID=UPI002E159FFA|nr:flavin reductase family protein [Micromonospora sp. NBC_01739]